ncbi:MAG TPA: hypothetical protein VEJ87_12100, partial [Acidimicrobiales bacterium]|nr:hypothetical protein [Acidimicrobiales bacterium]
MAMSLRNVGQGIAVVQSWNTGAVPPFDGSRAQWMRPSLEEFRPQSRDLYVPSGDVSFWQAAVRDRSDKDWSRLHQTLAARDLMFIDVLYTDHEGDQRTISRFMISPIGEDEPDWFCNVVRHWNLDRPDPRE